MAVQVAHVHIVDNSGAIKNASKAAIAKALADIGAKCETYAKQDCPVDTGNLRNSLSYSVNIGDNYVDIGTRVEYGKYVECGTSRMKAQPFLKPAAENHASEWKSIVENAMKQG